VIYQSTDGDHHYPVHLYPQHLLSGTVQDDNDVLGHEFGLSGGGEAMLLADHNDGIPGAYPLDLNGLSGQDFWIKGHGKRAVKSQRRFEHKHPGFFENQARQATKLSAQWYPILTDPNMMPVAPAAFHGLDGCGSGLPSEYCEGAVGSSGALGAMTESGWNSLLMVAGGGALLGYVFGGKKASSMCFGVAIAVAAVELTRK